MNSTQESDHDTPVWYFGFGANMSPATLARREGITAMQSVAGSLPQYALAFTYRGYDEPPCEPRFANIEPVHAPQSAGLVVHGVAHKITMRELKILDKYEGAGTSYERRLTDFVPYPCASPPHGRSEDVGEVRSGATSEATPASPWKVFAYITMDHMRAAPGLPSARYLRLLVNGAEIHGLDAAYIERLKAHPSYDCVGLGLELPDVPHEAAHRIVTPSELATHTFVPAVRGADVGARAGASPNAGASTELDDKRPEKHRAWLAMGGLVFDVSSRAPVRAMLRNMCGTDGTRHVLRMWASAFATTETATVVPEDAALPVCAKSLSRAQRCYVASWVRHLLACDTCIGVLQGAEAWRDASASTTPAPAPVRSSVPASTSTSTSSSASASASSSASMPAPTPAAPFGLACQDAGAGGVPEASCREEARLQHEAAAWEQQQGGVLPQPGAAPALLAEIDFGSWLEALEAGDDAAAAAALPALATRVRAACEGDGFFYALRASASGSALWRARQRAFVASHAFHGLPQADKDRLAMPSAALAASEGGITGVGYLQPGHRMLPRRQLGNLNASLLFKRGAPMTALGRTLELSDNVWPEESDTQPAHAQAGGNTMVDFRAAVEDYAREIESFARRLLHVFSAALDLPPAYFDQAFASPFWRMRLSCYPPTAASAGTDVRNGFGIAPHVDTSFFTLLALDGTAGLVLRTQDGSWRHVPSLSAELNEESLLVNVGEILRMWSNDRFTSAKHYVLPTPTGATAARYSIPFFFNPAYDFSMACLPSCCDEDNPPRFPPFSYASSQGVAQGE